MEVMKVMKEDQISCAHHLHHFYYFHHTRISTAGSRKLYVELIERP